MCKVQTAILPLMGFESHILYILGVANYRNAEILNYKYLKARTKENFNYIIFSLRVLKLMLNKFPLFVSGGAAVATGYSAESSHA